MSNRNDYVLAALAAKRQRTAELLGFASEDTSSHETEQDRPPPDWGGGAREPAPLPPPSMTSILRSALAHRDREILDYAHDLDRTSDHN